MKNRTEIMYKGEKKVRFLSFTFPEQFKNHIHTQRIYTVFSNRLFLLALSKLEVGTHAMCVQVEFVQNLQNASDLYMDFDQFFTNFVQIRLVHASASASS